MSKGFFGVWIFILLVELFIFFGMTESVHTIDNIYFIITTIIVTLAVGIVGFFSFKK